MSSWLFGSGEFDAQVEKATSEMIPNAVEDLALNLDICDRIRSKTVSPKEAMRAIKRRIGHKNPNVQLLALKLADTCVKNGGHHFLVEISSREFMDHLVSVISAPTTNSEVRSKTLGLVQSWAMAFKSKPDLTYVNDTFNTLRGQSYQFPPVQKTDAIMVDTTAAPDWTDSDTCERCRELFTITKRKHHCRNCGKTYCNPCSSRTLTLPHYGINQEVRVCEICYNKLSPGSNSMPTSPVNQSSARQEIDASRREEEELQRAIALSLLEAEKDKPPSRKDSSRSPKRPAVQGEEEDPELAAAIAASLREMGPSRDRSPSPSGRQQSSNSMYPTSASAPSKQNSSANMQSTAASSTAASPAVVNNDLNAVESQNVALFHQLMEKMDADSSGQASSGILHDRDLRILYDNMISIHPKVVRGIEEAVEKHRRLMELHEKLTSSVRTYDRLVELRSRQPPPQVQQQQPYYGGAYQPQAMQQSQAPQYAYGAPQQQQAAPYGAAPYGSTQYASPPAAYAPQPSGTPPPQQQQPAPYVYQHGYGAAPGQQQSGAMPVPQQQQQQVPYYGQPQQAPAPYGSGAPPLQPTPSPPKQAEKPLIDL